MPRFSRRLRTLQQREAPPGLLFRLQSHSARPLRTARGGAARLVRENRLYQADWLMRFYGFTAGELTPRPGCGSRPRHGSKLAWALRHREFFPVDVNTAPREALLRVPGFGVRNVKRILSIRRFSPADRCRSRETCACRSAAPSPSSPWPAATRREFDSLHLPARFSGARNSCLCFKRPRGAHRRILMQRSFSG